MNASILGPAVRVTGDLGGRRGVLELRDYLLIAPTDRRLLAVPHVRVDRRSLATASSGAIARYERFAGKRARHVEVLDVRGMGRGRLELMEARSVVYDSDKRAGGGDGRWIRWTHPFEPPFPRLVVDEGGVYDFAGGGYTVTARGIVG